MTITLKVGKYYQRVDMSVHGPAMQRRSGEHPLDFQWEVSGNFYNECGIRWDKPRSEDLVRECTRTGRPIQTKPRPKAKAKKRVVLGWAYAYVQGREDDEFHIEAFPSRTQARDSAMFTRKTALLVGPIIRIHVPMPAQKGKK